MMSRIRRYAPWIVLGTGALALFASDLLGLEGRSQVAVALAGAALTFVGILLEELHPSPTCSDARTDQHRAGHVGFVVLGALLVSTLLALLFTSLTVPVEVVLAAAVLVGLLAFQGSLLYQRRAA